MSKLKFTDPAEYKLTVKGELADSICQMMPDTAKITVFAEEDELLSCIFLKVKDQAQLSGILNFLYTNHYVILGVTILESNVW